MIVWRGSYKTGGKRVQCLIQVNAEKLAEYLNSGRFSARAFRKALAKGYAKSTRLKGGVVVELWTEEVKP